MQLFYLWVFDEYDISRYDTLKIMIKFIIDYNSPPKFIKKKLLEYFEGNIG